MRCVCWGATVYCMVVYNGFDMTLSDLVDFDDMGGVESYFVSFFEYFWCRRCVNHVFLAYGLLRYS